MVVVAVVLETYDAVGFTAWPIAQPTADRFLTLSGQMSSAEVGTAMAVIFSYNGIPVDHVGDLTALDLEEHLAETEALIAPGGLCFRDTATNVHITPGCCFGLESWRDWRDIVNEHEPWLGHDPTPHFEYVDQAVRLWQSQNSAHPSAMVEFTLAELPALLDSAQRQLNGFLGLVDEWTAQTAPGLGGTLAAALDKYLKVNE